MARVMVPSSRTPPTLDGDKHLEKAGFARPPLCPLQHTHTHTRCTLISCVPDACPDWPAPTLTASQR